MQDSSESAGYKLYQMVIHSFSVERKRAAGGALVLIVEDDEMVRRCLVRLIRAMGYMTAAYSSAEEFLVAKQVDEPVCLLLDATLPGMNGLELQRRLADEHRLLPIIFVSAHDEPLVREQALRGGAIAFFVKPFNDEALRNAVESLAKAPGK